MRPMIRTTILFVIAIYFFDHSAFAAMTLQEAERIALEKDPAIAQLMAESLALSQKAIADGALKDPRLTLAVASVPVDTFSMEQEPMTQQKIGIQQGFPRGKTLELEQKKGDSMAEQKRVAADLEKRKIIQAVRIAYQEVIYHRLAYQIILKSQKFLKQLVEIVEFRYASGKTTRQDVLEATLARSRTADRLLKIKNQEDQARARLSKWIPREAAFGPLSSPFVDLPALPEQSEMINRLPKHPSVQMGDLQIQTQTMDLLKAKEQYKPGWMVDANYGYRQGDNPNRTPRADFLSVMVSMDLPLFTENRQDRVHHATQMQVQAAESGRDDRLRNLASDLELQYADYLRLAERIQVFHTQLVPEAKQYTETAMVSYQSGVADLTSVVRAHLVELTIRLDLLEVTYKRLVAQAKLLFIGGEQS